MKSIVISILLALGIQASAQLYFPPLIGNNWDTISPQTLGWCTNRLDSLYKMLDDKNTKAFIVLKDGKIVIEKYFDTFTRDSSWYWASAGKTITSVLIGIAQQEGKLKITDSTSKYLGAGWTSCPPDKEGKITIRHQLTMTTGVDYAVPDWNCTTPACLKYKADAGTQWFYHNATYLLLQDVIEAATGLTFQQYTQQKLISRIGMAGIWFDGVYYSKPRSMARFGLMVLNKGIWNNDTIIRDTTYYHQMLNTSQNLNESYGYLWWLNGKPSYRMPASIQVFNGPLFKPAPAELLCGLGKDDQKLYVWPSEKMVIVRMGESADANSLVPLSVDTLIWQELNKLMCKNNVSVPEEIKEEEDEFRIYPNPASGQLFYRIPLQIGSASLNLYDIRGRLVRSAIKDEQVVEGVITLDDLESGIYTAKLQATNQVWYKKIVITK
ncbi:MAG: serine hydrolase [Bacteroidota bacterium]|jgi:CubicO group peptidase (beta-lactamase class C family)|nr:serine hydrolase [Sphingobacteriales bacterium]